MDTIVSLKCLYFLLVSRIQKTQRYCSGLDSWKCLLDGSLKNALVQLLYDSLDKFKIFCQCRTDKWTKLHKAPYKYGRRAICNCCKSTQRVGCYEII